jgi:hypothetical protein
VPNDTNAASSTRSRVVIYQMVEDLC